MRSLADPVSVPELWGVGLYDADVPYPVSQRDVDRDTAGASAALQRLGVAAGDHVLFVSRFAEAAQFWPFERAAVELGAVFSCADTGPGEAARVALFLRLLPMSLVAGVTPATLAGLRDLGLHPGEVLGAARLVLARPGAREELAAEGLSAGRIDLLGPAVAIGCAADRLHVDGAEWVLAGDGGRVAVSARHDRAAAVAGHDTGVAGRVLDRCPCGWPGQAVEPAEPAEPAEPVSGPAGPAPAGPAPAGSAPTGSAPPGGRP
ncbi:MAG TPA: hypothetical protein VHB02_15700 [Acidimicrobiales bacterium]|nr:hypothetical protein [Acidimicrobiales bacterium]